MHPRTAALVASLVALCLSLLLVQGSPVVAQLQRDKGLPGTFTPGTLPGNKPGGLTPSPDPFRQQPKLPLSEEKLIKKNPGQPTGDLPSALRTAPMQKKNLTNPNDPLGTPGGSSASGTQAASSNSGESSGQRAGRAASKGEAGEASGKKSTSTKTSNVEACRDCRAQCSHRRSSCGSAGACKERHTSCMRACWGKFCSG